jgi:hypothetical protein
MNKCVRVCCPVHLATVKALYLFHMNLVPIKPIQLWWTIERTNESFNSDF